MARRSVRGKFNTYHGRTTTPCFWPLRCSLARGEGLYGYQSGAGEPGEEFAK